MANSVSKYIPEFYEREFGVNVVSVAGQIADEIIDEIGSIPMNDYSQLEDVIKEFRIDDVIISGFKIRETSFLKSFFAFKGTNSDLQYIINNVGYDAEIYSDGTISHIDLDGNETVAPTTPYVVDTGGTKRSPVCELILSVILDLDSETYKGYNSKIISGIKGVIEERISLCSFIQKINVTIKTIDTFETLEFCSDDEIEYKIMTNPEDSVLEEYLRDALVYGQVGLKYGGTTNVYGMQNIPAIKFLDEEMFVFRNGVGV